MADIEVLDVSSSGRGRKMLRAVHKLGYPIVSQPSYESRYLLLWGWGGSEQQQHIRRQRDVGGNVVAVDIGYFGRDKGSCRVSLNANHPQGLLQYARPDGRADGIELEELHDAEGFIVLAGLGHKSRTLYNYSGMEWERAALARIRAAFPQVEVRYRPKPSQHETLAGTTDGSGGDIRQALRGCRLVVTHHSNVSTDCAVLGVPCVCVDGAGAFLWPSEITERPVMASRSQRLDFLGRLGWFNWYPHEAGQMIDFIKGLPV